MTRLPPKNNSNWMEDADPFYVPSVEVGERISGAANIGQPRGSADPIAGLRYQTTLDRAESEDADPFESDRVRAEKEARRRTQVKAELTGVKPDQYGDLNIRATAAKGRDGKLAVLVVRYHRDNNVVMPEKVVVRAPGRSFENARCHLTDLAHIHTDVPLELLEDGSALLRLEPLSFALIEFDR